MNRISTFGLGLMTFALFTYGALSADPVIPPVPNPHLTSGAVRETDPAVICTTGYDRAHRVWHNKAGTLAKYGLQSASKLVEDDDLIPVCAGGDNANPNNHWPQLCTAWRNLSNGIPICTAGPAYDKDLIERAMCWQMCNDYHAGNTFSGWTPTTVQEYFRTLQWVPK